MEIVMRSTNPADLAFAQALLRAEAIDCFVLDVNISILEGSIGVFPQRLAVAKADKDAARRILEENGLCTD